MNTGSLVSRKMLVQPPKLKFLPLPTWKLIQSDRGHRGEHGLVHFSGERAVFDARDIALPVGEVLPHRLVAEERIRRLVSVAVDRRHPRAECALADQNLLVEVLVAGPDRLEEV